jgi:hypothetical protein
MFSRNYLSWIILILFLCLFLFFPTGSSTTDAWYSAASIKYKGEIFHPHHLLYNALGYVFCYLPAKAGFDVLASLKVLNAFFAVAGLLIVQKLLRNLDFREILVIIITSLIGLSFAIMRYATENETYIVPLFFALAASYTFLKYLTTGINRFVLFTGIWMTTAVLFHQVYFLWWLGLLISLISAGRKTPVLIYVLISLTGPLVYLLVIFIISGNIGQETIFNFVLGDMKEGAKLGLSGKGLFLSFVNLIRSFVQVHGYMFNMIRSDILFVLPGIVSVFVVALSLFRLPGKNKNIKNPRFAYSHLMIIIMQFIFAMLAAGNAEFMVMIPVLVFILVPLFTVNCEKFLSIILVSVALWNISYGLLPLHFKSHAPEQFLCDESFQRQDVIVIASDDQLLKSMLYYRTGINNTGNIYRSPATLEIKGLKIKILEDIINDALKAGITIYTDCIGSNAVSRASIIEGDLNADFFRKYETLPIKTWESNLGTRSVYQVMNKL